MTDPLTSTTTWSDGAERYRFAGADDVPRIATMLCDPEVGRWLWFTPGTEEMFEAYFTPFIATQTEQLAAGETPLAAVIAVDEPDGAFLGQGAVLAIDGSPGGFEIGFQLRRAAWGRGVGMRLARFLVAYALVLGDAHRIEGACLEGNIGSRAILTRLGLTLEGTRPGYRLRDGVRHTELLFGAETTALDADAIRADARSFGLA